MALLRNLFLFFAMGLAFPASSEAQDETSAFQEAIDQYQATVEALYQEEVRIEKAEESVQAMNRLADATNKLSQTFMVYAAKHRELMHSPLPPQVTSAMQAVEQLRGKYAAVPRTMKLLAKRYPERPDVLVAYRNLAHAQGSFEQATMRPGDPPKPPIF